MRFIRFKLLLLVALLGAMANIQAQAPVANFTADLTKACVPASFRFLDQSSGFISTWLWNFGDGTTSTLKNPVKVYNVSGFYTITLTVTNSQGSNTIVKSSFIEVVAKPNVNFTASPLSGCFPVTVSFTDLTTYSGGGSSTAWQWEFNDGTISTVANPVHTFNTAGEFNISLYVENAAGCTGFINKPNYLTIGDTVHPDFDTTMQPYCKLPQTINFKNASAGSGTLTYLWDFGDGTTSTATNPTHNYTAFGKYNLTLTVTSSIGCSKTTVWPNYVKVDSILTDFSIPPTCLKTPFVINNLSQPPNVSTKWNFGDGTFSTSFKPSKTYNVLGSYPITLLNKFENGCIDSVTKIITFGPNAPVAFNVIGPSGSCKVPFTATFSDATIGAGSQVWDFGDGTKGVGSPVSHTYTTFGSFNVKLVESFASGAGCKDSLTKNGVINIALPKVSISGNAFGGCAPFTFIGTGTLNTGELIATYQWDFSDGFTSTATNPSHTLATPGVYTVRLIATSAGGCKDTAVQTIRVGGIQPVTAYSISPQNVCANKPVTFTDLSTVGNISFWDFGDGTNAFTANATHSYKKNGTYTITIRGDNNGCFKDIILPNYITVLPPSGKFEFKQDCNNKFSFDFDATTSFGATTYQWNFGDGSPNGSGAITNHVFATKGTYTVSLFTTNGTCSDTVKQVVIVGQSPTSFRVSTSNSCGNTPITFTARYETPSYVTSYDWDFGDGNTISSTDSIVNYSYSNSGNYTVTLTVKNKFGCSDVVSRSNLLGINGPKAFATILNPNGCTGTLVTFKDSSYGDGIHPITGWKVDFGDGTVKTYSAPPYTHTYTANGIYTVKVMVTDNIGCADTLVLSNAVNNSRPAFNFSSIDSLSCPGANIRLAARGQGLSLAYNWVTSVGNFTGPNAVANFPDTGKYTIKLYVVDANGCQDSLTKTNYITIKKPVASFSILDSVSICIPFKVRLTNTSTFGNRQVWDFDNGLTSFQQNPYVSYPNFGTYNIKLKVTSLGGCQDSVTKPVTVLPYTQNLNYSPLTGCQPLAVTFRFPTPSKGTYYWEFNDGTKTTTTDSFVTHQYKSLGPYLPFVRFVEKGSNCSLDATGSNLINVYGAKAAFGISDSVFCDGGVVTIKDSSLGTGAVAYLWDFGDGTTSTVSNPPPHSYPNPGTYKLRLIVSSIGCTDTLTRTINVYKFPKVFIIGDSVGCQPFKTTFAPRLLQSDTSKITWNWDFGNGQTSTLQNPPQQLYANAGSFVVRLRTRTSTGCISDTTKNIIIHPLPTTNTIRDTTVCDNIQIQLFTTGATNYRWLAPTNSQLSCTNCPNPIATPATPSVLYIVEGATPFGCITYDSVRIKHIPTYTLKVKPNADSLCIGESIQIVASGAQLYQWSPATSLSATNIANPIANPTASIVYTLTATDTLGCQSFTQTIPIAVFNYPTVNAGADVTLPTGVPASLIATASTDVVSYRWTPPAGITCTTCSSTTAVPKAETIYTVTATNNGGCKATDDVKVTVFCDSKNVFIPNTFSPNNDGINDVFYPRGTGLYSIKSFRIFNRWGQLIFNKTDMTPNNPSQGWNGMYNGKKANADVYTYVAEVYCENYNLITLNGAVNLIY
jgi:gliding motility-associated-like protein